eukprot:TRINITY_DN100727_c0_g1_i1.p1 TRINITY_DN100727_c0_g1~~TRINITY_DN100727_c0_g1_i1.p1  ORF type:complete len:757 (+),score=178.22 TRINITY_DN100727_c0_g1_i1:169-2439(+)
MAPQDEAAVPDAPAATADAPAEAPADATADAPAGAPADVPAAVQQTADAPEGTPAAVDKSADTVVDNNSTAPEAQPEEPVGATEASAPTITEKTSENPSGTTESSAPGDVEKEAAEKEAVSGLEQKADAAGVECEKTGEEGAGVDKVLQITGTSSAASSSKSPLKAKKAAATKSVSESVAEADVGFMDDIVPFIRYDDDDEKSHFHKKDRWIVPKKGLFPSVFCALRVRVRLERAAGSDVDLNALKVEDVQKILREKLSMNKILVRWDDVRDGANGTPILREIVAGVSGDVPAECAVGATITDVELGVVASVVAVTETSDDMDPARISSIATQFQLFHDSDALLLEVPQMWIIPDMDFRPKTPNIGLYPKSYWMGFLSSWGPVSKADIFFNTVQHKSNTPMVHLVVQFKQRQTLKMCFAFLFDRNLVNPKQQNDMRPSWCRLVVYEDFKAKASEGMKTGKPSGKAAGKAKAKAGTTKKAVSSAKAAVAKSPAKAKAAAAPGAPPAPASVAVAQLAAKARPKMVSAPKPAPAKSSLPLPRTTGAPPLLASTVSSQSMDGSDRPLTPEEAMAGMSDRQLEAFQAVTNRMEKLEKENQELMQILLQMQGLLQQQQQRNALLTQKAAAAQVMAGGAAPQFQAAGMPAEGVAGLPASLRTSVMPARLAKRRLGAAAPAAQTEDNWYNGGGDDDDEEAPWKSQRKRPRRMPRAVSASVAAAASAGSAASAVSAGGNTAAATPDTPMSGTPGMAAYHDMLLGK